MVRTHRLIRDRRSRTSAASPRRIVAALWVLIGAASFQAAICPAAGWVVESCRSEEGSEPRESVATEEALEGLPTVSGRNAGRGRAKTRAGIAVQPADQRLPQLAPGRPQNLWRAEQAARNGSGVPLRC